MIRTHKSNNHSKNQPLLNEQYKDVVFFSDMEYIKDNKDPLYVAPIFFKQLARDYPNSYFILNTRPKNNWLTSRILHGDGSYLKDISNKLNLSEEEVVANWSLQWDQHHNRVKSFFKHLPGRLIIFDIEKDNISKIIDFFSPLGKLKSIHYKHKGKTILN